MLHTIIKFLKFCVLAVLVLLGVVLCVENRANIDISFAPLPYVASMQLFVFAILMLIIGIILGWAVAGLGAFRKRREHKEADKRIAALENELAAVRSEQALKATALPRR